MGISDTILNGQKVYHKQIEFVSLQFFIKVLNKSEEGSGFDGFYVLSDLLDQGLSLWYNKSGSMTNKPIILADDVKEALTHLQDKLYDTDEPQKELFKDAHVNTEDYSDISLGDLFIKRSEVEHIYSTKYGKLEYPWAWELNSNDWVLVPVDTKRTAKSKGKSNEIKERYCKNKTDALVLLNAALDQMKAQYRKTPSWSELAAYVLGGEFDHPTIQLKCDTGQIIKNRIHYLADGSKLTRERIRRTCVENIFRRNPT